MILDKIKQALKEHKTSIPYCSNVIFEFKPNEESEYDEKEHMTYMGKDEEKEPSLDFCDKCLKLLQKLQYVKTQKDFSKDIMEMSSNYYSVMLAEGRRVPVNCLKKIVDNLTILQSDKSNYSKYIDPLIKQGEELITKTIINYY